MRKTLQDHQLGLINDLAAARLNILTEVRLLKPEQLDEVFLGSWCIKDLLAHLTGWDFTNLQAIQEIVAGQYPTFLRQYDKDWQSYNAFLVKTYRVEPIETFLAKTEESHLALIDYLNGLPAEVLMRGKSTSPTGRTVTIRNLLKSEIGDENKHAAEITAYFQLHLAQLTV